MQCLGSSGCATTGSKEIELSDSDRQDASRIVNDRSFRIDVIDWPCLTYDALPAEVSFPFIRRLGRIESALDLALQRPSGVAR
jgi:hypothetical protein